MAVLQTLVGARDLGRLQQIAAVFIRHGMGDAVRRMGWVDALDKAGHALRWEHAADLARLPPAEQTRMALEELGPTFVKLGQILAGRADLFGPEWIAEFEKLHSRAPAVPVEALRAQLQEDLGAPPEEVFAKWSDEPLAAASIAQVHAATLKDGTEVVVKVRRPDIVAPIESDLRLLERLAAGAARQWPDLAPYRPVELVHQLGQSLRRELDLVTEGRHAERIGRAFAQHPDIVIPRIHWDYTRERVNVQDRIAGIPAEDLDAVDAAGMNRHMLAKRGAQAVLQMIVKDGFFHADPHAGNVFFLPGERIAFIDFGMVGRVSSERRSQLLDLMLGLVQRDAEAVAEVLLAWTGDDPESSDAPVDEDALRGAIEAFVDQYHGVPLARLSLGGMLADVTTILRRFRLALPADLALLIKTFITLEGLGRGLDPDFHMAAEALPQLKAAVHERWQPQVLAKSTWRKLQRGLSLIGGLPDDLARLLRSARRGRVQVHIDIKDLRPVADQLDRAAQRITVGLLVAALIVGSSIVMTVEGGPTLFGLPAFGLIGYVGAVIGAIWLLFGRKGRLPRE